MSNTGFVPTPTTERDVQAPVLPREALAVGLTDRDQVCESTRWQTGGQGTYDMQSGFNRSQDGQADLLGARLRATPACNSTSYSSGTESGLPRRLLRPWPPPPARRPSTPSALKAKAAIVPPHAEGGALDPHEWSHHS